MSVQAERQSEEEAGETDISNPFFLAKRASRDHSVGDLLYQASYRFEPLRAPKTSTSSPTAMRSSQRQCEDLIQRAKAGDRCALESLLVIHLDTLTSYISRRMPKCSGAFSADDVTQDALLEAFVKSDRLKAATSTGFVAWLKAVGELTLLRFIRDQSRQKRGGINGLRGGVRIKAGVGDDHGSDCHRISGALDFLPGKAKTASSNLARRESIAAMRVAIAGLPEDQRRAIQLRILEGMSLRDAADAMGRSPAAVRGLVHRGKQTIASSICRVAGELLNP